MLDCTNSHFGLHTLNFVLYTLVGLRAWKKA